MITHLFAGVPVSDLDVGIEWYTRFFGQPPDMRVGEEVLWEIDEHATLFIEPNAGRAGAGWLTSPSLGSTGSSSASLPSAGSSTDDYSLAPSSKEA